MQEQQASMGALVTKDAKLSRGLLSSWRMSCMVQHLDIMNLEKITLIDCRGGLVAGNGCTICEGLKGK